MINCIAYNQFLLLVSTIFCGTLAAQGLNPPQKPYIKFTKDFEYILGLGDLSLTVSPRNGGRITSLKMKNSEFLSQQSENRLNYGSTLWPSPQSMWNWPPPEILDSNPYTASVENDTLVLFSSPDENLGLQFEKRFSIDSRNHSVKMVFIIKNCGKKNVLVSPWQISRVPKGAIAFFPKGKTDIRGKSFSAIPLKESNGILSFQSDPHGKKEHLLSLTDGSEGWLACKKDNLLLIKKFNDVAPELSAPGEGEVLLYSSGESSYIEIEVQGAYTELTPGGQLDWEIEWYLRELPENQTNNLEELVTRVRAEIN